MQFPAQEKKKRTIAFIGVWDGQLWRCEPHAKEVMEALGYEVKCYDFRAGFNVEEIQSEGNHDFVFISNGAGMHPQILEGTKTPVILWYSELLNNWNNYDDIAFAKYHNIKPLIPYVDGIIHSDIGARKCFESLTDVPTKCIFCVGTRPDYHIDRTKPPTKDLGFIGTIDPYRKQQFDILNKLLEPHKLKVDIHNFSCDHIKFREIIQDYKCIVNIHFSPSYNTEARILDVLGFGVPIVSEPITMSDTFNNAIQSGMLRLAKTEDMPEKILLSLAELEGKANIDLAFDKSQLPTNFNQVKQMMDFCEEIAKNPKRKTFYYKDPKPVTLALVMIIKDNASTLPRALDSITRYKGLFDSIYLCDTGSSREWDCRKCGEMGKIFKKDIELDKCPACGADKEHLIIKNPTYEVAKKYTDKIKETNWQWFGATRNIAKSDVKEDWIFSLDADEFIKPDDPAFMNLKATLAEYYRDGIYDVGCSINMDPNENFVARTRFMADRLFRNSEHVKWNKKVHNEVLCGSAFRHIDPTINIYHSREIANPFEQSLRINQRYSGNVECLIEELKEAVGSYKCSICEHFNNSCTEIPEKCPCCESEIVILKPMGDILRPFRYLGNTNADHALWDNAIKWHQLFLKYCNIHHPMFHEISLALAEHCRCAKYSDVYVYKCNECGHQEKMPYEKTVVRCGKCESRNIVVLRAKAEIPTVKFNDLTNTELEGLKRAIGSNFANPEPYVLYADLLKEIGFPQLSELAIRMYEIALAFTPRENWENNANLTGPAPYLILIEALERQGKLQDASRVIDEYLMRAPKEQTMLEKKKHIAELYAQTIVPQIRVKTDKKRMVIITAQDTFIRDIVERWNAEGKYHITVFNTEFNRMPDDTILQKVLEANDIAWFEFANEALIAGSEVMARMQQRPFVVTRIHGYECHANFFKNINWSMVDRVIFVASYLADMGITQDPNIGTRKVAVIPNGIEVGRYAINKEAKAGSKVCFAGFLNHKKDLFNGVEVFYELLKINPEMTYHIAGEVQDVRMMNTLILKIQGLGLTEKVLFYPWQTDLNSFFADKDYFISSSTEESFHVTLAEAMACGVKPFIRNWVSCYEFYPPEFIYKSITEIKDIYDRLQIIPPEQIRAIIENNWSLEREIKAIEEFMA